MIAGILLKGFKVYKNIKFIPFFESKNENFKLFIGPNGAGKSSIFEALDTFFNNEKWIVNIERPEAYIAPVFLVEKSKAEKFSSTSKDLIKNLSDYLWKTNVEDDKFNLDKLSDFFGFKNNIKNAYEKDYYLIYVGIQPSSRDIYFPSIDKIIKEKVLGFNMIGDKLGIKEQNSLNKIFADLKEIFTYIYLPAEINIPNFSRLESNDMQELIEKRIIDNIDAILTTKNLPSNDDTTSGQINILDSIDNKLRPYIDEVEKTIQKIEPGYKFQAAMGTRLSTKDLSRQIIKAYYAKRRPKINGKSIEDISSGERKKFLIDIIYSFLSQKKSQDKEIILAIDEPEASLDMSARYGQFERIEELANQHQILVATHWYGSLPIIQKGIIHHFEIADEGMPKIRIYKSRNYFEDRKNDPYDIYFKSFSDLAISILNSLRSKEINWIIVEGPDDKNYLEYYLKDNISNLRILPIGGCTGVKDLYQHLFISINPNPDAIKGKVYCLVDTDNHLLNIGDSGQKPDKLLIRRLQCENKNKRKEIVLTKINTPVVNPTEIEEVLYAEQFYNALKTVIENSNEAEVKLSFSFFRFDDKAEFSFIKTDMSILISIHGNVRNSKEDKNLIIDFVDRNKFEISEEYCKIEKKVVPVWIEKIIEYFNGKKIGIVSDEEIVIPALNSEELISETTIEIIPEKPLETSKEITSEIPSIISTHFSEELASETSSEATSLATEKLTEEVTKTIETTDVLEITSNISEESVSEPSEKPKENGQDINL